MRKILYWLVVLFLFCGWVDLVWGQTYTVGDTIGNINLEICENGEGIWDYHIDGLHNVTWINLFTSW